MLVLLCEHVHDSYSSLWQERWRFHANAVRVPAQVRLQFTPQEPLGGQRQVSCGVVGAKKRSRDARHCPCENADWCSQFAVRAGRIHVRALLHACQHIPGARLLQDFGPRAAEIPASRE